MPGKKIVLYVLLLLVLAGVPLLFSSQYTANLAILFFIYVIAAESWNLLGGYTGQISLGHAAFFGMGAIVTRVLWVHHTPILLAMLAGGSASAVLGFRVGAPCLRMRLAYFPIGTLALSMIAQIAVGNLFPMPGSLSKELLDGYRIIPRYYVALCSAVVCIVTVSLIVRSRLGMAMGAVRDNETAAASIGIRTLKHKIIALVVSSFFAGLAGSVYAYHQVSFYYEAPFALTWSFIPTLTTFIGGIGTLAGPVIGSLFFIALSELFAITLGDVHVLIFGLCFIFVVLFMEGGFISGYKKLRTVLSKR